MRDTFVVQMFERAGNLAHYLGRFTLREVYSLLYVAQEWPTVYFFKHQVKNVVLFKVFNELYNVFVSATVVEHLNFSHHTRAGHIRILSDYFHSKTLAGEAVPCLSHLGVGSLAQNHISHFVEIKKVADRQRQF